MSFVYFIESVGDDAIKIGTALNVDSRLLTLQCGNPRHLLLRAECQGDDTLERRYHRRFKQCRLRGEWFRLSGPVLAYLRRDLEPVGASRCIQCTGPAVERDWFCREHGPVDMLPEAETGRRYSRADFKAVDLRRNPPRTVHHISVPVDKVFPTKPCTRPVCANPVDVRSGYAECDTCRSRWDVPTVRSGASRRA